jgi:predicted dienelactone hydrolase
MNLTITTGAVVVILAATPLAAQNRIDGQAPDAPELAAYGPRAVGVRQFDFVNPDQVDVRNVDRTADPSAPLPRYDRPLTVEMWYPAIDGATGDTSLDAFLRDGVTQVELQGRAVRDAAPATGLGPVPLVLMSHGYPGNRFLMSHLAENIASKGYVVASIDHTDSTYRTLGAFQSTFPSTLVNRSLDQLFVLDEIARINADASSDLAGLIDTDNAGLIGYSMGGYGALVTAGAGVTETVARNPLYSPQGVLDIHRAGSDTHEALVDERIKTAVAIGPWGRQNDFWDAEGLEGIDIPMLIIGGSDDQVSQYEEGIRKIWAEMSGTDRALLTFEDGSHNTAAPIPAPAEAFSAGVEGHYIDDDWDTVFMNNVAQHFITAWFDVELKGDASRAAFLNLPENGARGWTGFAGGTADRLRFETLADGQVPAPVPLPASIWFLGLAVGGLGVMRARTARRA